MRKAFSVGILGLALIVGLVNVSVFAQKVNRSISLKRDAKIGEQALTKGEYEVKYVEGKDELVISQGSRDVLTATFKTAKLDKTPAVTSVFYSQEADGSFLLKRIEFKGKDTALVFENTVVRAINR